MGNKYPENMPPTLCQTMLRNAVSQYPDVIAVSFKKNNEVVKWTYKVCLHNNSLQENHSLIHHQREKI